MASSNKTSENPQVSVEEYLDSIEHPVRRRDAKTALELFTKVTKRPACMWGPSIIGFGKYHYVYESGREGDWMIVGFAPRKAYTAIYVMGMIEEDDPLRAALGKYKAGRGCLNVNKFEDIDLKVLEKIIKKSFTKTIKKYGEIK